MKFNYKLRKRKGIILEFIDKIQIENKERVENVIKLIDEIEIKLF